MKKHLLIFSIILLALSACEVTVVEEPVVVITDPRSFFTGSYGVDEYSETFDVRSEYGITILRSADFPESVVITNFYGIGLDILADVDINGIDIYIPTQIIDGYRISGSGYLEGNELILSYTVRDQFAHRPVTDHCSTVAWR